MIIRAVIHKILNNTKTIKIVVFQFNYILFIGQCYKLFNL